MSAILPKIPWLGLVGREGFEPVYPSLIRGSLIPNELPALKRKSPSGMLRLILCLLLVHLFLPPIYFWQHIKVDSNMA